jgi:hypothetical protein
MQFIDNIIGKAIVIGPALRQLAWDPRADDRDGVGPVRADEGVGVGVIRRRIARISGASRWLDACVPWLELIKLLATSNATARPRYTAFLAKCAIDLLSLRYIVVPLFCEHEQQKR